MKKLSLLTAFFCLFLTGAVLAQKNEATATNFAGTWELDAAKSKLTERMRVEAITLNVAQTDKEIKVETDVKRATRPNGEMTNGGNRSGDGAPSNGNRGGYGRGGMNGFASPATYSLVKGQHTEYIPENPAGTPSTVTKLTASAEKDGKLKLNQNTKISSQNGEFTVNTLDVWELLDGGKTLKITRETESPRGSQTSEMYFMKIKTVGISVNNQGAADGVSAQNTVENVYQAPVNAAENDTTSVQDSSIRTINGGVINGKSSRLPQPEYPPAAKAVNASGTVQVEVVLDEFGKVISASAVSGHPLLKAAAEKAARAAEFAPTRLSGAPVRVRGIITYNFIL